MSKGSKRRQSQVPQAVSDKNWDDIFGIWQKDRRVAKNSMKDKENKNRE